MDDVKRVRLWVLVTDGQRARIVVPDAPEGRFRTLLPLGVCAYPHCPPPLRGHAEHRHHGAFASDVAARLNAAVADDAFEELLIVAPAMVAHEIRELLTGAALERLEGTVDHDFVGLDDVELSDHLTAWWVQPACAMEMAEARAPGGAGG
jgi:hypothetical protein